MTPILLLGFACGGDPVVVDPASRNKFPPTAAEVVITPSAPAAGTDFSVQIVTPSTDGDGDKVRYRYAWTVDGEPASMSSAEVSGATTTDGERWRVEVTPTDGERDGPPSTAAVTVGNRAPILGTLTFAPSSGVAGESLSITFEPPNRDPDGDPVITTVEWFRNEEALDDAQDSWTVDGENIAFGDTFRVAVTVSDGLHEASQVGATVSVEYDCEHLPPSNLGARTMADARAYHGLTFDDEGYLLGYGGRSTIFKSPYEGEALKLAIGFPVLEQWDRLPDGDFVAVDNTSARILRITAEGGMDTIVSGLGGYVYGVTVGPDGLLYATVAGSVERIDPATGERTLLVSAGVGWSAHAVSFNLDSTVMYIGTTGETDVYSVPLDETLTPTEAPSIFSASLGSGWMDGIGVDVCGNVYVAEFYSSMLYRIAKDGTVARMVPQVTTAYGHGLMWGSGIGGWKENALYQPQPYNGDTVREVLIGFSSAEGRRTWNGVAVPW